MKCDGWEVRSLGELTHNFDSMRVPVKEADRRPGPYPYYGASGVIDYVNKYMFDGEYLLIAEDGENLKTRNTPIAFLVKGTFWVNNHAHIVRGNSSANTRFLMYSLANTNISGYLTGSTMPKLTQENMNRIPILTPPLSEQKAIAHILGTLDDKIELNRKMNETLEAMARAIFKSWFIDFDPVKRNMARRQGQNQPSPRSPLPLGEGQKGEGSVSYRGGYDFSGLVETVRQLRRNQTSAEAIFWELVRDRQFMGLKFRRQHQIGDYVADFYCHECKLVIELDGGIHKEKIKKDAKRDEYLRSLGFTVLHFANEQILGNPQSVLEQIAAYCVGGGEGSSPLPVGEGQGEGCIDEIDALFPDEFEDSELGEIPKGWRIVSFASTVEILGGGTPKTSVPEYWGGDIPWYAVGDAPKESDIFVIDTEKKITKAGVENSATRILPIGTTIISARGTVGKLALTGVPMAMNQTCYGIKGVISNNTFFTFFSTLNLVLTLQQRTHGSVFNTVTRDTLASVKVVLPSSKIIERFEGSIAPLMGHVLNNLWQNRNLSAIRDALLPKLISGEIRVGDAEGFLEAVL